MRSSSAPYAEFSHHRLVEIYDALNPPGRDVAFFRDLALEFEPESIVDVGSGTGVLTLQLLGGGRRVTGIEPSAEMLAVARRKPDAHRIEWVQGSVEQLQAGQAELLLMTSHVAQFFLEDASWVDAMVAVHQALVPGGRWVFDVRRRTHPVFPGWPIEASPESIPTTLHGPVEWWHQITHEDTEQVHYDLVYRFSADEETVVSHNVLAFRSEATILSGLTNAGFEIDRVYGDWTRGASEPSRSEMIFVAQRTDA